MSEIEKIRRYIERTKMKRAGNYAMVYPEACELFHKATDEADSLFDVISLAFDYGKAKGYRAAKAEAKKVTCQRR